MSWEHKGYKIDITDRGTFTAKVGEVDVMGYTLAEAKEKLEKEAVSAAKRKLNLPVVGILTTRVNNGGTASKVFRSKLQGVNRTTREWQVDNTPADATVTDLLPDTEANLALLETYLEAKAHALSITNSIRVKSLAVGRGYGRIEVGDYEPILQAIEARYKEQL